MPARYGIDRPSVTRAAFLFVWLVACDLALKALARAACGDRVDEGVGAFFGDAGQCQGLAAPGGFLTVGATTNEGLLFGIGGGTGGFGGQAFALVLLAVATVATIGIVRWRWHSTSDPIILGTLWAGAALLAAPRLAGKGSGLAEVSAGGLAFGVGDVAFTLGLAWVLWRVISELRA